MAKDSLTAVTAEDLVLVAEFVANSATASTEVREAAGRLAGSVPADR